MLELRGVSAGYGATDNVLHDVSLSVPDGSVVALLGANGSGKTTTLRIASRILNPRSGQIFMEGKDVTTIRPEGLARLGVCHVPEGRGIFPSLTVAENLLIFANKHTRRTAIDDAVAAFPALAGLMNRPARSLSGGQQQMVGLSRAYICTAKVALLDEVSMGLAPLVVQEIFKFIPKLVEQGTSLLIVEQYVSEALRLADYAYVMKKGKVAFQGTPDDLRASSALVETYLGGSALSTNTT
jgi:branched-chain amino acid transport system ATP-binding protein